LVRWPLIFASPQYGPHPLLVPWSRKCRAIPLLPLWAVRSVQSLSACTRVYFTFTFTSVWNVLQITLKAHRICWWLLGYWRIVHHCMHACIHKHARTHIHTQYELHLKTQHKIFFRKFVYMRAMKAYDRLKAYLHSFLSLAPRYRLK
jgi:hypothetical protein